jgi:beta-catenin-like protein 1
MASKSSSSSGGGNSVTDVLDRVIGLSRNNNNNNNIIITDNDGSNALPAFIASDKWSGVKHGYVYRTSSEFGTGYHLDNTASNGSSTRASSLLSPALKPSSLSASAASSSAASAGRENKRARFDTSRDITHAIPARPSKHHHTSTTTSTTTGEELLAQAEASLSQQQSSTKLLELSIRGVQIASTSLSKTHQRNSILRAQFPTDPEKYMLEELSLHDEIMNFASAAVNLSLYEHIVNYGVMNCFVELMNHDNVDVCLCVVNVLMELLDPTLLSSNSSKRNEEEDGKKELDPMAKSRNMALLANAFLNGGGMELLSSNLGRLDESVDEEAKGVEDVLTLVESLLDLDRMGVLTRTSSSRTLDDDNNNDNYSRSSVVACICQQTTFVSWLFQRIEKSDSSTEDNAVLNNAATAAPISPAVLKLHASEVLSAILQHADYSMQRCGGKLATLPQYTSVFTDTEEEDTTKMGKNNNNNNPTTIDGMEILLLAIAAYRKSDPQIEVECEFLENVFDALAASLLREDNVVDFVKAEGIELMLRCLRQNLHAGGGALKVLNFALSAEAREEEAEDGTSSSTTAGENNAYRRACETFIQAGGLKIIFPLYMGRKSAIPCPAACSDGGSNLAKRGNKNGGGAAADAISKRAKRAVQARKQWLVEVEQNTIHIIYALTRHIAKDSQYDAYARLLVKFLEEDCVRFLVLPLHFCYHNLLSDILLHYTLLFLRKNVTGQLSYA